MRMFTRILCIMLVAVIGMSSREASASASASETPNVAIFNIKREKVTQVVPYTADFEKSLLEVLQSSPTMFGGFSLNPRNGLVLRFIFSTPIQPEHRLYPNRIKELYLFLEPLAKPKALLFLTSDRPKTMVVEFNYDTELFVRRHQLEREWLLSH